MTENKDWKKSIITALKKRNESEGKFTHLINLQNYQAEKIREMTKEKELLKVRYEDSQRESNNLRSELEFKSTNQINSQEFIVLEKKLFKVQEELTELHRRKGENAQQVIDLTQQLKIHTQEIQEKDVALKSQSQIITRLKSELEKFGETLKELKETNQLLKDEYQTLQLALHSAENKLLETQRENERLVNDIMKLKAADVARMNAENETFVKQRQIQVQQQIQEALNEAKSDPIPQLLVSGQQIGADNLASLICTTVQIPNRAYLQFDAHEGEVNSMVWSPHGLVMATGGADRRIKLWDVSKGRAELRGTLSGSNAAIMSIDYDAAGTLILGSSSDFASRVWTVNDCRNRHTLTGHSGKVLSAKFLVDSNKVVTGSHDRTLKIWDLRSRSCISTKFAGSSCNDLVTKDSMFISGHFDKKIRFYDSRSSESGGGQPSSEILCNGKVTSLDLSKDGRFLTAFTRDDSIQVIDLRSMKIQFNVLTAENFFASCDWSRASISPDSNYVAAGSGNGHIFIWDITTGVLERVLKEHESPVISVAWQPAGNSMTSCDKNKKVIVWTSV